MNHDYKGSDRTQATSPSEFDAQPEFAPLRLSAFQRRFLAAAIVSLTASMLAFEVLQTITLSLQIFAHNAFLVVSISLLGLGGGGSLALLLRHRRPHLDPLRTMELCALGFALTVLVGMFPGSRSTHLVTLILLLVVPYLFVGIFLSILFSCWPKDAPRSYFLDLIGSSLGCLLLGGALVLLGSASSIILIIASGGALSALCLALARKRSVQSTIPALITLAVGLGAIPFASALYPFHLSKEKPSVRERAHPGNLSTVAWSKWNFIGRLDAVDFFPKGDGVASALQSRFSRGWGVRVLYTNGGASTAAIDFRGDAAARHTFATSAEQAIAYLVISPQPTVLNIGLGAGIDVFLAIENGAREVTGVEINPLMIEAIGTHSRNFWGIDPYNHPRVTLHKLDGRTFVNATERHFDLVTLTAVDSYSGMPTSSYVLSENYLYTQEAFDRYFELLNPGGVIYVRRPVRQMLRLLATAVTTMAKRGIADPSRHVVVLRFRSKMTNDFDSALIFRDPPSPEQLASLERRSRETNQWEQVAWFAGPPARFAYGHFFTKLRQSGIAAIAKATPFDISPVKDNRPFFYQTSRRFLGSPAAEPLLTALSTAVIVSLILIFAPLTVVPLQRRERHLIGKLMYFMAIGVGFMFTEIVLMQKLGMFLGHPSYSLAVTLFGILLFSGLGSLVAGRLPWSSRSLLKFVFPAVAVFLLFYAFGLTSLLLQLRLESLTSRIAVALLVVAPGSFLLGMPFPLKIREIAHDSAAIVSWAWAINAFFSVIASILSTIIAINFGFTAVLLLGVLAYLIAHLAHLRTALD